MNIRCNYRIYEARRKKGWSVRQLSKKSGISKTVIYDLECPGCNRDVRFKTMCFLAYALGVGLNEICRPKIVKDEI